jgi:hypothetical protein
LNRTADTLRACCPFCGEPWTDAMLTQYDSLSFRTACSCCASSLPLQPEEKQEAAEPITKDLCCDHCSRVLYLAPSSI